MFDSSSLHGASIDEKFKIYTKNEVNHDDDEDYDDSECFPSIDRFGDDFPNKSLHRYESDIIDVLKHVASSLDSNNNNLKTIKEIVFKHNNFSFNHTYKEIKGDVVEPSDDFKTYVHVAYKEYLEPYYYTTIIGLVVDDHVIEFAITTTCFNRKYEERITIFYDKRILSDMDYKNFLLKTSGETETDKLDEVEVDEVEVEVDEIEIDEAELDKP